MRFSRDAQKPLPPRSPLKRDNILQCERHNQSEGLFVIAPFLNKHPILSSLVLQQPSGSRRSACGRFQGKKHHQGKPLHHDQGWASSRKARFEVDPPCRQQLLFRPNGLNDSCHFSTTSTLNPPCCHSFQLWNTFHRPALLRKNMDTCLKDLGLPWVDMVQLHYSFAMVPVADET